MGILKLQDITGHSGPTLILRALPLVEHLTCISPVLLVPRVLPTYSPAGKQYWCSLAGGTQAVRGDEDGCHPHPHSFCQSAQNNPAIPESTHTHAWSRPEAPSNLKAAGAAQAILTSGRTYALGLARPGQVQGDLGGKTFCLFWLKDIVAWSPKAVIHKSVSITSFTGLQELRNINLFKDS